MDGKVALVTGGARGQGRSHAIHFAREGADVIVTDICEQIPGVRYPLPERADLDETVALVEAEGRRCVGYVADARDGRRMRQIVDDAVEKLGRLDTVAINHGIALPHSEAEDLEEDWDVWDTVIATNLSAVYKTASVCIPHLRERGGAIIITGSASTLVSIYNNASYTASKHGLLGLARSLAADLSQCWIRVNVICPTGVNTPLFLNEYNYHRFAPGKPDAGVGDLMFPATALNQLPVAWIEPEDVSKTVVFLASDEAKYITGVALPIDAGMTSQPPGISPIIGQRLGELEYAAAHPPSD